ncbi:MAG TPA: CDF family Co(II)/Ni(II) efflux transporter DmeF [Steroidobacteraceae bacterium]|jgi:Co/Zn/Cd efflux system component
MTDFEHSHVFLAPDHERSERKTWAVIWLCGLMMAAEVTGGLVFGSIALVADGLHMSTHAGALLLAALAYNYARSHARDPRFSFGTGKLGDLAGFTSAMVLAMIALLIGYESVARILHPIPIQFAEAIPIACLGLAVNIASAWLLSGGGHDHHSGHRRGEQGHEHAEAHSIDSASGRWMVGIDEPGGEPPHFKMEPQNGGHEGVDRAEIETVRADGCRQTFVLARHGDKGTFVSLDPVPEPHEFTAEIRLAGVTAGSIRFEEDHHASALAHRDNNMRAAIIHVAADAAVSILVIFGLVLAQVFGWLWMDPLAGMAGAIVIASWSYGLIRDTSSILLDMNPDLSLAERVRATVEGRGDRLTDLHLWRVGPGHLAAIVGVATQQPDAEYYRRALARFKILSHITLDIRSY